MFLKASHPWNPGYALPANVKKEPAGRGVIITYDRPRGTIDAFVPEQFYSGMGSLGADDLSGSLSGHVLKGNTLGHDSLSGGEFKLGSRQDPIAGFGKKAAALVVTQVMSVPPAYRKETLKSILDSISPTLWDDVAKKIPFYLNSATTSSVTIRMALEKALGAAFANHYLKQARQMATTGRAPQGGLMGLGSDCGCDKACASLAGFWDGVYKYTGAKAVVKGTKWAGGKTKAGVKAAYNAGKKAVKGLGKLACAASKSGLLDQAISMGSKAAGAPVPPEAAGKVSGTINELCPGGVPVDEGYGEGGGGGSGLMLPLLIGGGVLAAILLLRK